MAILHTKVKKTYSAVGQESIHQKNEVNLKRNLLTLISEREGKANSFSLKYVFSHSKGNSRAGCIRINDMSKCMYIVHCTLVHYTIHAYIANMHKVRQIYLTVGYTALPAAI